MSALPSSFYQSSSSSVPFEAPQSRGKVRGNQKPYSRVLKNVMKVDPSIQRQSIRLAETLFEPIRKAVPLFPIQEMRDISTYYLTHFDSKKENFPEKLGREKTGLSRDIFVGAKRFFVHLDQEIQDNEGACGVFIEPDQKVTSLTRKEKAELADRVAVLVKGANPDFPIQEIADIATYYLTCLDLNKESPAERLDTSQTGLYRDVAVKGKDFFVFLDGEGDKIYQYNEVDRRKVTTGVMITSERRVEPIAVKIMKDSEYHEGKVHEILSKGAIEEVADCYAAFTVGSTAYLLIEGANSDLWAAIHRLNKSDNKTRLDWAIQCIEAIEEMHQRGYVHRDIKPANYLVFKRAENLSSIKLSDFGMACREGRYEFPCGTCPYFPPEYALSGADVTFKVDIWAYGCLLVELFTDTSVDQLPWVIPSIKNPTFDDYLQKMAKYFGNSLPGWQAAIPDTPFEEIDDLLMRIFQIDPKQRPTATEIKTVLKSIQKYTERE